MPGSRHALAYQARLQLKAGADERAPGAAVTTALCGHWEHHGGCRWPHNSRIDSSTNPAVLRVIAVAHDADHAEIVRRIEEALGGAGEWFMDGGAITALEPEEAGLANRLLAAPPAIAPDDPR